MFKAEDVERLAYHLWEREGCPAGKDKEHYFAAERILRERGEDAVGDTMAGGRLLPEALVGTPRRSQPRGTRQLKPNGGK